MNKTYKRKLTSAISLETIAKKFKAGKNNTNSHINHSSHNNHNNHHHQNNNKYNKKEDHHEMTTKIVKRNSIEDEYSSKRKPNSKNINSKKNELRIHNLLRNVIQEAFGYTLKSIDIEFMKNQFTGLPVLDETWARIGFNQETQDNRLKNFYEKLNVSFFRLL
jgi:hypothetical protein